MLVLVTDQKGSMLCLKSSHLADDYGKVQHLAGKEDECVPVVPVLQIVPENGHRIR